MPGGSGRGSVLSTAQHARHRSAALSGGPLQRSLTVLYGLALPLFVGHLAGIFLVLVELPGLAFTDGNPALLTMVGEFVVKNLVLLTAGVVVGTAAHHRADLTTAPPGHPAAVPAVRATAVLAGHAAPVPIGHPAAAPAGHLTTSRTGPRPAPAPSGRRHRPGRLSAGGFA